MSAVFKEKEVIAGPIVTQDDLAFISTAEKVANLVHRVYGKGPGEKIKGERAEQILDQGLETIRAAQSRSRIVSDAVSRAFDSSIVCHLQTRDILKAGREQGAEPHLV